MIYQSPILSAYIYWNKQLFSFHQAISVDVKKNNSILFVFQSSGKEKWAIYRVIWNSIFSMFQKLAKQCKWCWMQWFCMIQFAMIKSLYYRFAWPLIQPLLTQKLRRVSDDFYAEMPTDQLPSRPNTENVQFHELQNRVLEHINRFNGWVFFFIWVVRV